MCTTHEIMQLSHQLADEGFAAHGPAVRRLAHEVRHVAPAAAAVLLDGTAPEILRQRAFAVAASRCVG